MSERIAYCMFGDQKLPPPRFEVERGEDAWTYRITYYLPRVIAYRRDPAPPAENT